MILKVNILKGENMTQHESGMNEEQRKRSSEMIQKQRAFEEGRGHDVAKSTMTTGQGGPEAGMEMRGEPGQRPHVMQEEEPSTREYSKAGAAMSGSQGTEGTVTGGKRSQEFGSEREQNRPTSIVEGATNYNPESMRNVKKQGDMSKYE